MGDYMEDHQCNHKSFDLYYIINTIPCVYSHALNLLYRTTVYRIK